MILSYATKYALSVVSSFFICIKQREIDAHCHLHKMTSINQPMISICGVAYTNDN